MQTDTNHQPHTPLTKEQLTAALTMLQTKAASIIEGGSEHAALVLAIDFKDGVEVVKAMDVSFAMQSNVAKDTITKVISQALTMRMVPLVAFLAEAWTLDVEAKGKRDLKDKIEALGKIEVSTSPDKKECLIVSLYTLDGQYTLPHEIERDADGKRTLKRVTLDDAFENQGPNSQVFGALSLQ